MTIEEQLTTRMKNAMRTKNQRELDLLRMVKSQAQIVKTAPGFSGSTDDGFWRDVIVRFVKQQQKALTEFEAAGEKGQAQVDQIHFEIDYLKPFLPQKLGEPEVRAIVQQVIAESGIAGSKMVGKVIGLVMKGHKDEVDADLVKKVATELLG